MKILQNLFLLSAILFLSTGVNADTDTKQKYIPEEVIVFVTLKVNKNNSKEKIAIPRVLRPAVTGCSYT